MTATSTQNCNFYNPVWEKNNQLYPISAQNPPDNANFQFASSSCNIISDYSLGSVSTTLGFTHGEILISFFLFLTLLLSFTAFIVFKFLGIKVK